MPTVGGIPIAEYRKAAGHGQPWGLAWDEHDGVAPVPVRVGVRHSEYDQQPAVVAEDSGRPPLVPVDDVAVSVPADRCRDVRCVRGGHAGFGHAVGRSDLALEKGLEPDGLLMRGSEHRQQLHVAWRPGRGRPCAAER